MKTGVMAFPLIVQSVRAIAPDEPTSPLMLEPVQVTAVTPRTENPDAAPSVGACANAADENSASKLVDRNF
jgi:hypothetical protein